MAESILGKVILEVAGGAATGGGGSPSGTGATGGRDSSRQTNEQLTGLRKHMASVVKAGQNQPKWWAKASKTAGVQMGIAGVLKQSQVFTGVLGSIFQILGAMIDVLLAPFIKPVLMPLVKYLSKAIPHISKFAEKAQLVLAAVFKILAGIIKKVWSILDDPAKLLYKIVKFLTTPLRLLLIGLYNMTLGKVLGIKSGPAATKNRASGAWSAVTDVNAWTFNDNRKDMGDSLPQLSSDKKYGTPYYQNVGSTPFVSGVTPQKRRDMAALRTGGVAPVGQRTAPIIPFPSEQRGWDEEGGGFHFSGSPTGSPAGGASIGQKDITVKVALANNLSYEYDDGWW